MYFENAGLYGFCFKTKSLKINNLLLKKNLACPTKCFRFILNVFSKIIFILYLHYKLINKKS